MSRKRRHPETYEELDFDDASMFGDDLDVDGFLHEQESLGARARSRRQAYRHHEQRWERRRSDDAIEDWDDYN